MSERPAPDNHDQVATLVKSFIQMMQAGNIARLELEHGDLKVTLRAHGANAEAAGPPARRPAPIMDEADATPAADGLHTITAPMIGTFYDTPAPGEPPFVQPGDHVEEGQTVGIIEAMKIMNEIAADRAGTVVAVLAASGQTVEYGSALVRLDPDA